MGNFRRFKNDLGWTVIRLLLSRVRRRDIPAVLRLGRFLGWLSSHLLTLRKSVAFLNLDVALGDTVSRRQKRRIFRSAVMYAATIALETLRYCFEPPETLIRNVRISGLEHLKKARASGRGVVLAGGHVGTFTLVAVRLSREGYRTWVILRFAHDPRVARLYSDMMQRFGVSWIADRPRARCIRECLSRLLANDALHVLIDQKPARGMGCDVPFFGIPTEMFPGAVSMALKTGAVVLPVTIHRHGRFKHLIEIGPPIEMVRTADRQEEMAINLTRVVETFEEAITSYPEEWWVISRRWTRRQVADLQRKRSTP